jgi:hypothetical protein
MLAVLSFNDTNEVYGRHSLYAVAIVETTIQRHVLLRKEVIQPHLPIRLPCYDFVPLT